MKTHLLHFLFFCFQLNALAFLQVVDHVSVTNLEQAWLNLAVFKLSRYVTAPASVNSATFVLLFLPFYTTNLSSTSIPQAILVLYASLKSYEEDVPSAETLSVVTV